MIFMFFWEKKMLNVQKSVINMKDENVKSVSVEK